MTELTYAAAGVDTRAGDVAVELMKAAVRQTHGPAVWGGVGGFAGLYDLGDLSQYRRPLLATSTDGVGTKVAIAQAMDIHDTIGFDLVGMVVDDIVVCGAKPLFMTDYIACGAVVPQRVAAIVRGIAQAAQQAGTALIGGETAEHPGLLGPEEYDVAGAATGIVDADALLGPQRVAVGDVVVAMASSGLHANGYSLVRAIVARQGWAWDRHLEEFGRTVGEELLEPTRVYAMDCWELAQRGLVHAFTHITGGGLAANVARVLPQGVTAVVDRSSWRVPPVFQVLRAAGNVPWSDAEATWNLGVGMAAIVPPEAVAEVVSWCTTRDISAWPIGVVDPGHDEGTQVVRGTKGVDGGAVRLIGSYQ